MLTDIWFTPGYTFANFWFSPGLGWRWPGRIPLPKNKSRAPPHPHSTPGWWASSMHLNNCSFVLTCTKMINDLCGLKRKEDFWNITTTDTTCTLQEFWDNSSGKCAFRYDNHWSIRGTAASSSYHYNTLNEVTLKMGKKMWQLFLTPIHLGMQCTSIMIVWAWNSIETKKRPWTFWRNAK